MVFNCSSCPDRKGDKSCTLVLHEAQNSLNTVSDICPVGRRFHAAEWRRQKDVESPDNCQLTFAL
jgi:hypothetical protein